MKLMDTRFPAGGFAAVLVCIHAVAGLPTPAEADGVATHAYIAQEARKVLNHELDSCRTLVACVEADPDSAACQETREAICDGIINACDPRHTGADHKYIDDHVFPSFAQCNEELVEKYLVPVPGGISLQQRCMTGSDLFIPPFTDPVSACKVQLHRYAGLEQFLADHMETVRYGAMWPDWPYAYGLQWHLMTPFTWVGLFPSGGFSFGLHMFERDPLSSDLTDTWWMRERTPSQHPYRDNLTHEILPLLRTPSNLGQTPPVAEWSNAFLLGVISHQEADHPWHDDGAEGVAQDGWTAWWQTSWWQPSVELATDVYLFWDVGPVHYWAPSDALFDTRAVSILGPPAPFSAAFSARMTRDEFKPAMTNAVAFQANYYNSMVAGNAAWQWALGQYDNNKAVLIPLARDHRPGGLLQTAWLTAEAWRETWDLLFPSTTLVKSPAGPDGSDGWYTTVVTVRLSATDKLALPGTTGSAAFTTYYGLNTEDATETYAATDPILLEEGVHRLLYYSSDPAGHAEELREENIKIDNTPPVVEIDLAQERYTRTEPLVVRFDAEDALSGLDWTTATFDSSPVVDGETVNLFLLPPGTYTLTARAADRAGLEAERSVNITLRATLGSLRDTVSTMCAGPFITKNGTCSALGAHLDAATAAVGQGHPGVAVHQLRAFQSVVTAHSGKGLTDEAAALLLADSNDVISDLGV